MQAMQYAWELFLMNPPSCHKLPNSVARSQKYLRHTQANDGKAVLEEISQCIYMFHYEDMLLWKQERKVEVISGLLR